MHAPAQVAGARLALVVRLRCIIERQHFLPACVHWVYAAAEAGRLLSGRQKAWGMSQDHWCQGCEHTADSVVRVEKHSSTGLLCAVGP